MPRQGVLQAVVAPEQLPVGYEARGAENPEIYSSPCLISQALLVLGYLSLLDEFGTWLASNPNDAPDKLGKALDASAATVRAQ